MTDNSGAGARWVVGLGIAAWIPGLGILAAVAAICLGVALLRGDAGERDQRGKVITGLVLAIVALAAQVGGIWAMQEYRTLYNRTFSG
jgi:hypothetical protein